MDILAELRWRGLIHDLTHPELLAERLGRGPTTLYAGFDPTADSLHIGHLVPLIGLRRFQVAGHRPIAVAGGATGMIGDPSGKSAERQLLSPEVLAGNVEKIQGQLQRLLDFSPSIANPARLMDNAAWMRPISFLDFLRDVGKHFSVNAMVAKESVRARMEDREVGISYTEFSYQLLQAYDFCHLNQTAGCELQIGGSDQWGNITAGIEFTRKKAGNQVYGLTLPLITRADGQKFGKTEGGAVWLDAERTSPYRLFQYFIQADDRDVVRYLKFFTFLPQEEIAALEAQHNERPEARAAHRALAEAVTGLVHGEAAARDAIRASAILFGGGLEGITEKLFAEVAAEAPRTRLAGEAPAGGWLLPELLAQCGLSPSKGQARKDIESGGIYVNNERESDPKRAFAPDQFLFGRYLLLRKGKRTYAVAELS
jgi:tyrosyl-tRNA synthetase